MKDLLLDINTEFESSKIENRTKLEDKGIARFLRCYTAIITQVLTINPEPVPVPGKRGMQKDSKGDNLARRLKRTETGGSPTGLTSRPLFQTISPNVISE
jgi:hypothetical protein